MASGRREQGDEPHLAFVEVEVALYVGDVGRVWAAAGELVSRESGKAEKYGGNDAKFDVSSLCH